MVKTKDEDLLETEFPLPGSDTNVSNREQMNIGHFHFSDMFTLNIFLN